MLTPASQAQAFTPQSDADKNDLELKPSPQNISARHGLSKTPQPNRSFTLFHIRAHPRLSVAQFPFSLATFIPFKLKIELDSQSYTEVTERLTLLSKIA